MSWGTGPRIILRGLVVTAVTLFPRSAGVTAAGRTRRAAPTRMSTRHQIRKGASQQSIGGSVGISADGKLLPGLPKVLLHPEVQERAHRQPRMQLSTFSSRTL